MSVQIVPASSYMPCLQLDGVQLKKHQKDVARFMAKTNEKGLVVFHGVGSGKTLTGAAIANCLLGQRTDTIAYVLTPKSVVAQFVKELDRAGLAPGIRERIQVWSPFMWLNRVNDNIINPDNCLLIVDEVHHFKGIVKKEKPIYTWKLMNAAKRAWKVVLLTATPLINTQLDVINYMAMIKDSEIVPYIHEYVVFTNVFLNNELPKYTRCRFSVHDPTQVDYPSKIIKYIKVRMSRTYSRAYMQLLLAEVTSMKIGKVFGTDPDSLTAFYQAIRKGTNSIVTPGPKIAWTVNKIRRDSQKKTLVYSTWIGHGTKLLEERFTKYGISFLTITGSVKLNERRTIVQKYNEDKVQVLIISSAGTEGLDLKGTRNIIVLEPFWHESRIEQVIGRGVRYKSHTDLPESQRKVTVYNLLLSPPSEHANLYITADEILYSMGKEKTSNIDEMYKVIRSTSIETDDCISKPPKEDFPNQHAHSGKQRKQQQPKQPVPNDIPFNFDSFPEDIANNIRNALDKMHTNLFHTDPPNCNVKRRVLALVHPDKYMSRLTDGQIDMVTVCFQHIQNVFQNKNC